LSCSQLELKSGAHVSKQGAGSVLSSAPSVRLLAGIYVVGIYVMVAIVLVYPASPATTASGNWQECLTAGQHLLPGLALLCSIAKEQQWCFGLGFKATYGTSLLLTSDEACAQHC
jgi:hypothetical protein